MNGLSLKDIETQILITKQEIKINEERKKVLKNLYQLKKLFEKIDQLKTDIQKIATTNDTPGGACRTTKNNKKTPKELDNEAIKLQKEFNEIFKKMADSVELIKKNVNEAINEGKNEH